MGYHVDAPLPKAYYTQCEQHVKSKNEPIESNETGPLLRRSFTLDFVPEPGDRLRLIEPLQYPCSQGQQRPVLTHSLRRQYHEATPASGRSKMSHCSNK